MAVDYKSKIESLNAKIDEAIKAKDFEKTEELKSQKAALAAEIKAEAKKRMEAYSSAPKPSYAAGGANVPVPEEEPQTVTQSANQALYEFDKANDLLGKNWKKFNANKLQAAAAAGDQDAIDFLGVYNQRQQLLQNQATAAGAEQTAAETTPLQTLGAGAGAAVQNVGRNLGLVDETPEQAQARKIQEEALRQQYPFLYPAGEIVGEIGATAPVGGALGLAGKGAGTLVARNMSGLVSPVANAVRSVGNVGRQAAEGGLSTALVQESSQPANMAEVGAGAVLTPVINKALGAVMKPRRAVLDTNAPIDQEAPIGLQVSQAMTPEFRAYLEGQNIDPNVIGNVATGAGNAAQTASRILPGTSELPSMGLADYQNVMASSRPDVDYLQRVQEAGFSPSDLPVAAYTQNDSLLSAVSKAGVKTADSVEKYRFDTTLSRITDDSKSIIDGLLETQSIMPKKLLSEGFGEDELTQRLVGGLKDKRSQLQNLENEMYNQYIKPILREDLPYWRDVPEVRTRNAFTGVETVTQQAVPARYKLNLDKIKNVIYDKIAETKDLTPSIYFDIKKKLLDSKEARNFSQLRQVRQDIGDSLYGTTNKYSDQNIGTREMFYKLLSDAENEFFEQRFSGVDALPSGMTIRELKDATVSRKNLEENIKFFGGDKDALGSVVGSINAAASGLNKGIVDTTKFKALMANLLPEQQKAAIGALTARMLQGTGKESQISLAGSRNLSEALRQNGYLRESFNATIGPQSTKALIGYGDIAKGLERAGSLKETGWGASIKGSAEARVNKGIIDKVGRLFGVGERVREGAKMFLPETESMAAAFNNMISTETFKRAINTPVSEGAARAARFREMDNMLMRTNAAQKYMNELYKNGKGELAQEILTAGGLASFLNSDKVEL